MAQTPLRPVNVKAVYQQAQNRTQLSWDAQIQYRVAADLRTNGTAATWRGKDVYAERQGQTPYRWGLQNIGSAQWRAQGNELEELNNAGGIWYFRPGLSWRNYTFEFDVRIAGTGDDDGIGITWRYKDSRNYYHFYMCGIQRYSNCRISRFRRRRNNTTTNIQNWPLRDSANQPINQRFGWLSNTVYRFRVIANGNNFQVAVRRGGTGAFDTLINYTETNVNNRLDNGAPGTYSFSQADQRYDNFSLTYQDTETKAVQSALLTGGANVPWNRLGTQSFRQLLNTQITTWATNYNLNPNQVVASQVYVDVTNQTSMFEAKASTNGVNTTSTNQNSFPYARVKANQVRSLVFRNNTQLPGMPITAFTHNDTFGPCTIQPNTRLRYNIRVRNAANQTSPNSANADVTTVNAAPTIAAFGPFTIQRNTAFLYNVNPHINDLDSPKNRLTMTENSQYGSFSQTTLRVFIPNNVKQSFVNITITVTDCFGAKANRVIRFNITNRPPVLTNNTPDTTATVGTVYTYDPKASDPDADNPLKYTLGTKPPGANVNPTTGVVTWTPAAADAGKTFNFNLVVCDAFTPPACVTKAWTVKVGNRPPVITSTPPTTAVPLTPYTYPVKATDPEGGILTYKLKVAPTGATITPTGAISWTPTANDGGKSFPFEVEVCDNGTPPLCANQKWNVKTGVLNTPPQIVGTPPTKLQSGQALTYGPQVRDQDLPNDSHTWKLEKGPTGATIDANTGELTWTPAAGDEGKDIELSITVCDKAGACATQTWKVRVTKGNSPPIISGTPATKASPGVVYAYKPTAKDDDPKDVLTFKLDKAPNGATIDPQTGQIAWTPGPGDEGKSADFTVTVCDQAGACASQSWKVRVDSPNAPPAITSTPSNTGTVAQAYAYSAKVTDPDAGDTHTWSLVKGPTGLKIDPTSGGVTWIPAAADDNKEHEVTIKVCDDKNACATQTWNIRLGTGNKPPTLTGTPPTTGEEGKAYTYGPTAKDDDPNDVLTFKLDQAPAGATIDPKTGKIDWTPPAGTAGTSVPFGVSVCDNNGSCASQTWWVKIKDTGTKNTPPVITSTPPNTGLAGQAYTYPATAQDPDAGDTKTWTVEKGPTGLAIATNGQVTWTPTAADVGKSIDVTIKVCDKAGDCASQSWKIQVLSGNHPPQIDGAPGSLASPTKDYTFQPTVSDPDTSDAGKHKWTLKSGPTGATLDPTTGALKWRAPATDVGKVVEFEIEVCDPAGACATRKWKVRVTLGSTNNNPTIVSKPDATGYANSPYTYAAKAVDPDVGDVLKWSLKSGPQGAKIDPTTGALSWTPGDADAGKSATFEIEVCDQANGCDTQKWTVAVAKGNGAPQITTQPPVTAYTGEPLGYEPKATDPEGDALTWSFDQAPPGATIDPQTGKISWTPGNPDADKPATFSIRVCDNGTPQQCATQTFTVTPRQKCKVDIDCASPSICTTDTQDKLVCTPAGCADDTPKCSTSTDFCKDGACKPNPCDTTTCGAGEICRPSDGKCIKPCAGVTCQQDEICVDGTCEKDPCATAGANKGPCAADETCDTSDANTPKCVKNPCNDKTCRHSRVCDDARCIDDPCAGMKCPTNTRCVAGQCKDLQPCKVDLECPGDQVCLGDKCRDQGCYTQTPKCPASNICNEATCKDDECPAPGGIACGGGQFCRPVENKCVPTCAGVTCQADEQCIDGLCAKDACANKQCKSGDVCVQGDCQADNCNGPNRCKHGRVCSKRTNRCIDDPCGGLSCPEASEACVEGQCIKPDCRFDKDCQGDQICVQRKCIPTDCKQQSDCKANEICVDGKCAPNACDGKTCPAGQFCKGGNCVAPCAGVFCEDKKTCIEGKCVDDPCAGVTCAADEVCQNGTCAKDLCKGQTDPCKDGRLCQVDSCTNNPCDGIKCPDSQTCSKGQCIGDQACDVDIECAGDGVCIDKKCAPPQCYKDGSCANGQLCLKGKCVDNPCATKQCNANETCRPADGTCVPNCPKCADGERCKAGVCEADPCKDKQCAADESCDDSGTCVKDKCATDGDQNCRYKRVCTSNSCQDDPCADINCPAGSTCNAGVCIGDQNPGENPGENASENPTDTGGTVDGGDADTNKGTTDKNADAIDPTISVTGGCGCNQSNQAPFGGLMLFLLTLLFFRRKQA